MNLGIGTHLGGYEIVGLLGSGGMGEVYRAHDPGLDRQVALKVIAADFAANPKWRERFRREARVLATLSHPNIATVYAVEEDKSVLALSMELVEGQSLKELVRPGGMATDRLLKISIQIADALSAAHQRGITHRDLKPANVLVAGDGRVKVLDFGLAKLAQQNPEESGSRATMTVSDLTAEGHLVGTPAYMSPEQAEGRDIDYRSDIFSFGILLYELATGELPFKGQSVLSILSAIVRDNPPAPVEVNPRIPRQLSRVIRRCLAKDVEERYQSAKDLRSDLSDLRQELTSGEIAGFAVPRSRRHWWRWAALGSTVVVLTTSGWLAGRRFGGSTGALIPTQIAQLTVHPGIEMAPSLSPDGRWVVYAQRGSDRTDIYLQAVGGENAINLTKSLQGSSEQPTFSADGESIAFRSESQGGGLFVMGRTGELVRRVTDTGYSPSWAPDGKWLVYSTGWAGDFPSAHPGGAELWIVSIETGEKRRLNVVDGLQPAWSPDGQWVAYWGVDPATHQRDLWRVSVAGGSPQQLTNDPWSDISPAWSPDGTFVYFASDRGGTLNLWRLPVTARMPEKVEPVSVPGIYAVHPTVSGDGRRIAYATFTRTSNVLAVPFDPVRLEIDGSPRGLLGGQQDWSAGRVSPDGSQLALVRWAQRQDLFLVGTRGEGLRRLTSDPLGVRCPEWAPDSTRLAYMRGLQTQGSVAFIDIKTGDTDRLSTAEVTGLGCPSWSRDGQRIAIAQAPPHRATFIFYLKRNGGRNRSERLPDPEQGSFIPRSWSRNDGGLAGTIGSRIAIYSFSRRKYEMLTEEGSATGASATFWLPGDRHILFMNADSDLLVVDVLNRTVKRAFSVPKPQVIRGASLTDDGRELFYIQGTEEGDIWVGTLPSGH